MNKVKMKTKNLIATGIILLIFGGLVFFTYNSSFHPAMPGVPQKIGIDDEKSLVNQIIKDEIEEIEELSNQDLLFFESNENELDKFIASIENEL